MLDNFSKFPLCLLPTMCWGKQATPSCQVIPQMLQDLSPPELFCAETPPTPNRPSREATLARSSSSSFPREGISSLIDIIFRTGKACTSTNSLKTLNKNCRKLLEKRIMLCRLSLLNLHSPFQLWPDGDDLGHH